MDKLEPTYIAGGNTSLENYLFETATKWKQSKQLSAEKMAEQLFSETENHMGQWKTENQNRRSDPEAELGRHKDTVFTLLKKSPGNSTVKLI